MKRTFLSISASWHSTLHSDMAVWSPFSVVASQVMAVVLERIWARCHADEYSCRVSEFRLLLAGHGRSPWEAPAKIPRTWRYRHKCAATRGFVYQRNGLAER